MPQQGARGSSSSSSSDISTDLSCSNSRGSTEMLGIRGGEGMRASRSNSYGIVGAGAEVTKRVANNSTNLSRSRSSSSSNNSSRSDSGNSSISSKKGFDGKCEGTSTYPFDPRKGLACNDSPGRWTWCGGGRCLDARAKEEHGDTDHNSSSGNIESARA